MPKIAIVAGETSGDIHAGNLARELLALLPEARIWAVGGEHLAAAGAEIIYPSEKIASMGITEVLMRLPQINEARRAVVERFTKDPPDLFVPVDFGGLNLKFAREAKRLGIPVVYFIPPKAWAWGRGRVEKVRCYVDEVLVILPFEHDFWQGEGVKSTYVGSPVLDHIKPRQHEAESDLVGLFPGSRRGEIKHIWPQLVEVARLLASKKQLRFMTPLAESLPEDCLKGVDTAGLDLTIVRGRSQEVMERSRLCVMASGTVTLECALVGTPLVAVYRVNPITSLVAKMLVKLPYVTLPNLIAGKGVVPEFLQRGSTEIAREALSLIDDGQKRAAMLEGLQLVKNRMNGGGASRRAAEHIAKRFARST